MNRPSDKLMPLRTLNVVFIDVPALRPGTVGAYAFALLSAGVATALRVAIDPYVAGVPFVTFFPAVIITSLISGFGAGLFCLVLSTAAASFLVLPPRWSFYIQSSADVVDLLLFILEALFLVVFVAGMRSTIERYRELNQKLQHQSVALRKSQERHQSVAAELQHRTRNLISIVGSVADRTLRTSKTLEDFRGSFRGRLEAIARAQGLLSRMKEGDRVTFDELIEAELCAQSVDTERDKQITLDGPKGIRLRSGTVQPLAMVLHELVTNALKYGALKQPNGHLTIRWRQKTAGESGKPWLHLDWKESGVEMPPLGANPQGTGEGRELIEQVLPYQCGAHTTFVMEPDGVHCTISLRISEHT